MAFEYPYATIKDVEPMTLNVMGNAVMNGARGQVPISYTTVPNISTVDAMIRNAAAVITRELVAAGYIYPLQPLEPDTELDLYAQDFIRYMVVMATLAQIAPQHTTSEQGPRHNAYWQHVYKLLDDMKRTAFGIRAKYRQGTAAERALTDIGIPVLSEGLTVDTLGVTEYVYWKQAHRGVWWL